ncbi:putative nitrile-specifier protein 5 [Iris pallida]|uniref:Nitrile-specifier protein 5 n=1 Tax=Iris pallida TaxID=29817 RepID=A0AAX6IAK4_IRIPA|nr:putative nitrile-specifier protein 5 [Iris pallida]
MAGKWIKLPQKGTAPGARSSHAIAVVGTKAYAFGGEFTPRVPVDNKLHVFDLDDHTWSVLDAVGDVPPPRVGVTMAAVGTTIYVFGGRDSKHEELNELYSFDTLNSEWTLLSSGEAGPPHRSYHSMTADDRRVYVFGGCGNAGRLNDLWAFDARARQWTQLASPGEKCRPRGGPGLAVVAGRVWVVYGFSGEELDDVHCFDPAGGAWEVIETGGDRPSPRSVFSAAGVGKYVVVYGGEIDPSDQGHMGAGMFSREAFALDTETLGWRRLEEACDDGGGEHPGPRGWCAFSGADVGGHRGLLVYGGNSATNDRLDDIFFFDPCL